MARRMNKKAVFFSIISLFIVFMLVLDFRVATRFNIDKNKISAQNTRIKVMNNLVYSLEERSFERMFYVASKAAFLKLSEEDSATNIIGNNELEPEFTSVLLTGKLLDGTIILNEFFIQDLIDRLQVKFEETDLNITQLEVSNIELRQDNPWEVIVEPTIKYELTDNEGVAGWRGRIKKTITVSIYGFDTVDGIIKDSWKKSSECAVCGKSFLTRIDSSYLDDYGICRVC